MRGKAKKLYAAIALALAAMLVASTAAIAAVTFNPETGEGFVGKGDVQTALGLNNAQLQNAQITFRALKVTEHTWTCDRDGGPQTQERATETTAQQLVSSTARVKNQITGFNLIEYSGAEQEVSRDGPPVGSCPTGWTAINQSSSVISSTLQVSKDGTNYVSLT
jgi:hypothetical protein